MAEALIQLERVGKTYRMPAEDVHALRDVSLSIDQGEFVSVVGASGSGKTTLLYLLGMLTGPSTGTYLFGGDDVAQMSDRERSGLRGRSIGFVFQSFHLLPQLSVLDNVLLAMRYVRGSVDPAKLRERARDLIEQVGLAKRIGHRPRELSGGEMQRVAIARALLTSPRLILADEPTGNLDEANSEEVVGILEGLANEGHTVLLVTHDMHLAERTPRCIRLRDGMVANDPVATA